MKLILHIGTEKTGSTTIQECLYRNQKKLAQRGYYFIQSTGEKNNREIPSACMRDSFYDDFFNSLGISTIEAKEQFRQSVKQRFSAEMESLPPNIHTVLVSSEHFHSRNQELIEIQNVADFFDPYFEEAEIVCYLRDQLSVAVSLYSTAIKNGSSQSLQEFLEKRNFKTENNYFNYYQMLQNWESKFPGSRIIVRLFDREQFLNGSLLDDFFSQIAPNLYSILDTDIRIENESLTHNGQALWRALNIVLPKSVDRRISEKRENCERTIYRNFRGMGEQPSLEIIQKVSEAYAQSNELLRKKYFSECEVLFSKKEQETRKIQIDENYVSALAELFVQLSMSE